jgi:hypothetical protein
MGIPPRTALQGKSAHLTDSKTYVSDLQRIDDHFSFCHLYKMYSLRPQMFITFDFLP